MSIAEVAALNPNLDAGAIAGELELVRDACKQFDLQAFREGHLSAGVLRLGAEELRRRRSARRASAASRRRRARRRPTSAWSRPTSRSMSAFVFKIQANMDPNHRDRIAFARLCSGKLTRGMKVKQVAHRQADRAERAAVLLRAGPRGRRRGLCRRRGRHPQPRRAADRRHADRRRGDQFRRRAELRAGNPAPRAAAATP